jgi:uncharacterized membrane protein
MPTEDAPPLPPHVEETVAAIASLHVQHYQRAGTLQRFASAVTATVARPSTLAILTVAIVAWVALNLAMRASGLRAPDPYPFPFLAFAVSAASLCLTAMVLITQRHDDELATRREQLTLELAILSEQKSAKIIALLEEFRRNDPNQSNHRDELAEALAKPADTQAVLDAIREAHVDAATGAAQKKTEDGG